MTLVLMNDTDDLQMSHLFFVHVCTIMELRQSQRIGKLRSHKKQTTMSSVLSIGL